MPIISGKREFDEKAYLAALQNFIVRAEKIQKYDAEKINGTAGLLADFLRFGYIDIVIYDNEEAEKNGRGISRIIFDSKKADMESVFVYRTVVNSEKIFIYRFAVRKNEPEWNKEELERIKSVTVFFNIFAWRLIKNQMDFYIENHNPVFGLYNITYATRRIEEILKTKVRYGACAFNIRACALLNETYGRENVNIMIRQFLGGIRKILDDENELLAHFGGDNFFVFFDQKHMEAVLDYLSGTEVSLNNEDNILFSAWTGVYIPTAKPKGQTQIVDSVMFALNLAKKDRQEKPVIFSENEKTKLDQSKWVFSLFDQAIKNEEFLVYYQPKVCIKDYTLVGAEALCRWKHGDQMINPGVFVPPLEHSSGVLRLDFYMLEHACRDIRRWMDEGRQPVRVSVNLSRRHFGDKRLLEHLVEIIDRNRVPHQYIEIELTETSTEVELKELRSLLLGLKNQGIRTAVDDFGTGYSSLNLIRELPWDVLKLDKSFLDKTGEDARKAQMMFSHVIALAHELGMECITEGIETEEDIKLIKENNCYLAQGFFFDRPLPVAEFEEKLGRVKR